MTIDQIRYDCRYFRGDIPCKPNKLYNSTCPNCTYYSKATPKILIIKLGAIGDVIRTTPLIVRLKKEFPNCHITWVTLTPDVLPPTEIDTIYTFDFKSTFIIGNSIFDIAINLDKEPEACILLEKVTAKQKFGFGWNGQHIIPATTSAQHKLITGFFDSESQKNTKSYLEEIFEICGFEFQFEEYLINIQQSNIDKWKSIRELAQSKKIVGLNTGCGKRWITRMWAKENWVQLIQQLQNEGYFPVLLGGPDEHTLNEYYHKTTKAYYPGFFPRDEFIALCSHLDSVVTAVSMMMHIATALKVPMILFNNIFNKNEFELYGRGEIVSPTTGCDCFYGTKCTRSKHCMNDISVDMVLEAVKRHTK